jgi:hypothetical protein
VRRRAKISRKIDGLCSSLFTYCTQFLRLSEGAAYGRIQAARAAARFPVILDLLVDGLLNLTTVGLLAPHLTVENHRAVLDAARGQSKRAVEEQAAALRPRPDVPTSIRKLPAQKPRETEPVPSARDATQATSRLTPTVPPVRPPIVAPLAPERFQITVTVSRETHDKLRRAQDLLRHVVPNGDPAAVLDRALTALVAGLERTKLAATKRSHRAKSTGPRSRHIPAAVRRAVWKRDGGRCAFVGAQGRCRETGLLEFHHVVPFAVGGKADVDGIELRCAQHNKYEAEQVFGPPSRADGDVRRHGVNGPSQPWLGREGCATWAFPTDPHEPPMQGP